jgi:ribonuclease HI
MTPNEKPGNSARVTLIHADESCLGNGMAGENPGGAGVLVETVTESGIARRDLYISSPDTTNNRMALHGAIVTLATLGKDQSGQQYLYVSDSQYLVKGMNEWIAGWRARGWRRKGGAIENLAMWQELDAITAQLRVEWKWVRGHSGHPKNEYVDELAVRAATNQVDSSGFVESELAGWLANRQARGQFHNYDADKDVLELNGKLTSDL